jgi:hypothetical protein
MDRAIVGLLTMMIPEEIRGLRRDVQKDIGIRHARQFVAREPVKCLSVTQADIAVVRGNLLGWLLVWRLVSPNQIFFFTI